MHNKIFPIKNDPACLLKWGFSSVYLNVGQSNSCHRCLPSPIPLDDFASFHNLPDKVQARQDMLDGKWPEKGCWQYCGKMEELGGLSDRLLQLQKLEYPDLVAPELWNDATATTVTPTMLEVYFQNTCNMKCMYCRPDQSSQWEQELRTLGPMKTRVITVPEKTSKSDYNRRLSDLWKWLENNHATLRRYHVLGGEPFLLDETEQSFDFWLAHPNDKLVFTMFSNLNIEIGRFQHMLEKMRELVEKRCVYKFELTVSIDCWNPQAEYVRYGLDLDTFVRNFDIVNNLDWLDLHVNSAVTALTIKSMPELLSWIDTYDQKRIQKNLRPIELSFNLGGLSSTPKPPDNPVNIGGHVFDEDFARIISAFTNSTISRDHELEHLKIMHERILSNPYNPHTVFRLKQHLDELDQRRGTDWKQVFPWLMDLEDSPI